MPRSGKPDRIGEIDFLPVAEFRSALRRFDHATDEITRRHGLTRRRYELLVMIAGAGDRSRSATISDIAARMHLAPHTATELVSRAEKLGLVERGDDRHDGRVTRVTLTSKGERQLIEAVEALRPERDRLTRLLAEVYQRARNLTLGAI